MSEETLRLLRDIPEFESEYEQDKDKFNHKTYGNILLKIIEDNPAPLVIGLLGPWGSGKSTTLNLFKNVVKDSCKVVYFNAWKYSNDSFRRQFLVETANCLIKGEREREKFIGELNLRFVKELNKQYASLKELPAAISKVKLHIPALIWFSIVTISIAIGVVLRHGIRSNDFRTILCGAAGLFPFAYVVKFFIGKLLPGLFKIEADPKIVLPEQFEKEFGHLIGRFKKKVVFIIDDVDRCPPHMIMEILDSAKTFFASSDHNNELLKKCYFIIAIDDKAVTSILQKERGKKYGNEEVLKFFDATLRLNPISHADLVEFSKFVAKEAAVPEEAVQIAIYGGFDTPRKIKHFLNAFKVRYSAAKKRKEDGIFNFEIEKITAPLSKMLILEIAFPEEFEQLKENYKLLDTWEEEAQNLFGTLEDKESASENAQDKPIINKKLLRFLWATSDTQISDLQALLHLKIPAYATNLPFYSELKEATLSNDQPKIKELAKEIKTKEHKDSLVEFVRGFLDGPSDSFLHNTLSSSLAIYKSVDFGKREEKELSQIIIRHVERYSKVLNFAAGTIFGLVANLGQKSARENKIVELGTADLARKPNPEYASEFISLSYRKAEMESDEEIVHRIDKTLEEMVAENPKWVVEVLTGIKLAKDIKWEDFKGKGRLPKIISEKVLPLINEKEEDIEFHKTITKTSFKFWDESFMPILSERCLHILRHWNQQSVSSINPNMRMVIEIIGAMPGRLDEEKSSEITSQLSNLHDRVSNSNEKLEILKARSIAAHSAASNQQYISQVSNSAVKLDVDNLKKFVQFIESYENKDEWWTELKNEIAKTIITNTESAPNDENNLKKFDFIYSHKEFPIPTKQTQDILEKVFTLDERTIDLWEKTILKISKDKELSEWIINKLEALIRDKANLSVSHREKLFNVLIEVCKKIKGRDKNTEIGNFIFDVAKKVDNPPLMSLGARRLETARELLEELFPTKISNEIQEICGKQVSDIFKYEELLNSCINFQEDWTEETYKLFIAALCKLINTNSSQYLDFAYNLFQNTNIKRIPKGSLNNLKHSAKLVASSQEKDRWGKLLKEEL